MAYNDDSVLARLSSLNESHDSIATAAQWIIFHRRHADRTAQLWMQRLKDSSSTKRLSLMYLANEVVQQSRIRHKEDFVIAFSPIVAEASSIAYRGAPAEIQAKLRRVIDVWKDRSIFEAPIQKAIEARLDEIDKARGTPRSGFGGSPFGGTSVPAELAPIVTTHQKVVKLGTPLKALTSAASQEYEKHTDPGMEVPSAPVYAARLNGLLKTLASAESAVAECVKAREEMVSGLEKLLDSNGTALVSDRKAAEELRERKVEVEGRKQQVEMAIMQALGPVEINGTLGDGDSGSPHPEHDRPEIEALTPPPVAADHSTEQMDAASDSQVVTRMSNDSDLNQDSSKAHHSTQYLTTNGSNKRRRVDDSQDFPDLGVDDGIDPEVAQILESSAEV